MPTIDVDTYLKTLDALYDLREANSEIARHHKDFKAISGVVHWGLNQIAAFEGNVYDQARIGEAVLREIRSIVG